MVETLTCGLPRVAAEMVDEHQPVEQRRRGSEGGFSGSRCGVEGGSGVAILLDGGVGSHND